MRSVDWRNDWFKIVRVLRYIAWISFSGNSGSATEQAFELIEMIISPICGTLFGLSVFLVCVSWYFISLYIDSLWRFEMICFC